MGSQMSALLMAHTMTFRRACAAAALGHTGPLPVNAGTPLGFPARSHRSGQRHAPSREGRGQPSGGIPVFNASEFRGVGKKFSGVSRREAIGRKVESSTRPDLVVRSSNGPLALEDSTYLPIASLLDTPENF